MEYLVMPQGSSADIMLFDKAKEYDCKQVCFCFGAGGGCPADNPCIHNPCTHNPCECNNRSSCPFQYSPVCPQNDCNIKAVVSSKP